MPHRKSFIHAVETATLRRSPRFCSRNPPPEPEQNATTRRSLRFLRKNDASAPKVYCYSKTRLRSSQTAPLKTTEGILENVTKRSSNHGGVSIRNEDLSTGSGKAPTLENGFDRVRIPRRSSRLSCVRKIDNELEDCKAKGSKNSGTYKGRSSDLKNLSSEVRRSPRLNNGVGGHQCVGRSRNFSCQQYVSDKSSRDLKKSGSSDVKGNSLDVNVDMSMSLGGITEAKGEKKVGNSCNPEENAAKAVESHEVNDDEKKKPGARKKRKREDDGIGITQEWNKEQEAALQRAYYAAKPSPQFWKKVSKLVPGKSAQECFDKIHSDHSTPPQPRTRTRGTISPHIELLSLAEGKLLNPDDANARKPSRDRRKSQGAQKAVRYLLQKSYQRAQTYEADLFSLLEPNMNQSPKPIKAFSSPGQLEKPGFLHTCNERSSSNHKKPLSRFSGSVETTISPPVLKQVKNRALHEKYIDQLHSREAKRKAALKNSKNCFSEKAVMKDDNAGRTDNLRAARNALISDARDAINQLQNLHANAVSNSPNSDSDDCFDNFDDEHEDEI